MINKNKAHIYIFILLLSTISFSLELGIASFEKQKDGTYLADIYMLNDKPLAGFQLDLLPKNSFEILSISGGNGEKAGFNMSAGKKGTMLGFSFSGAVIEPSKTKNQNENILFTLSLKSLTKLDDNAEISFTAIMAGRGGEKIETVVIPYKPIKVKKSK